MYIQYFHQTVYCIIAFHNAVFQNVLIPLFFRMATFNISVFVGFVSSWLILLYSTALISTSFQSRHKQCLRRDATLPATETAAWTDFCANLLKLADLSKREKFGRTKVCGRGVSSLK